MVMGRPPGDQEGGLELRMTSMIDVVFLLLIFFIVTLNIPREEAMIETELPKGKESGETVAPDLLAAEFDDIRVILDVDEFGQVSKYLNDQRMLTAGQMLGRLKAFRELNEQGRVVISCHDDVPYENLVEVISVAHISGLSIAFADLRAEE